MLECWHLLLLLSDVLLLEDVPSRRQYTMVSNHSGGEEHLCTLQHLNTHPHHVILPHMRKLGMESNTARLKTPFGFNAHNLDIMIQATPTTWITLCSLSISLMIPLCHYVVWKTYWELHTLSYFNTNLFKHYSNIISSTTFFIFGLIRCLLTLPHLGMHLPLFLLTS